MNDNSATPDLKNSQQMIDLESGQPYRLGARGLEPVDMYADSEVPQHSFYNYTFPTGSVYGFGMKRRRCQRTPASSVSASNVKILHIVNLAGIFHILFGLIKF